MKQILNSKTYPDWPNIEIDYHKPVELFIDSLYGYSPNIDSFRILYVKEAESISNFRNQAILHKSNFDVILTFDDEILRECSNAYFMLFGTSWIKNFECNDKKFQVSNITGHKNITDGHRLRQKIHYKQNNIIIPKDFYISKYGGVENVNNNNILGEEKEPLFDSQFHICIENSRQNNYFSEKLIDCVIKKSIPIYYGCPNISDFFNVDGMYIAKSFDDIIDVCNSLTENDYNNKKQFIEQNFTIAQKYVTIVDRLENVIKEILAKNGK